ncbi:hypothetical protein I316_06055 [Kwoniella heveanensis BCC8398]|uniref:Ketoreductase domain-containing protein n=1 Tax=Kwoniella heveanensis BCC8398 TaxID=1296120 RepID=A0A1B9GNF2_9TREE|nr:hypothetical protein I316_06055 [Kwoniella heveanensis BCC8398]
MVWQIDFKGKTIVVTGGNRGIGLAISKQIAQAGASLAIVYRSSKDAPEIAKKLSDEYGVRVEAYQCDVADQAKVGELFQKIWDDMGSIAGLVCNAGVNAKRDALDLTLDDFNHHYLPNVWGVFTCAQAVARLWVKNQYKNGRIVFVSSSVAEMAVQGENQAFYNSSKAAINNIAQDLAMEWAKHGITVNCSSPGFTMTDMNEWLKSKPEILKTVEGNIMLGRAAEPEEQAGPVVFLLSDYASCE